jgi:chromosome partition protein MukE
MSASTFETLEDVIRDDQFPIVDLALRRGRHVGREDGPMYDFLVDARGQLEPFYGRLGCVLVEKSEGYFYLLPSGDRLGRRLLSVGEMLVGQALALLFLDPLTLQHASVIYRDALLQRLDGLVGRDALVHTLNPRRRRFDDRIAEETVRTKVSDALRRLAELGFIDLVDGATLRLRPALMRFAEPVREVADPATALEQLISAGELVTGDAAPSDDELAVDDEGDAS